MPRAATYAKTDTRYWLNKVKLPRYTKAGQEKQSKHYAVRIRWRNNRFNLSLGVADKEEAARKARDIYRSLEAKGWEATMAELRPTPKEKAIPTVGDFLSKIKGISRLKPKTFTKYAYSLRFIVAESFGIGAPTVKGKDQRYAPKSKEFQAWRDRIDAVKLDELTPARIQAWQADYIRRAREDSDPSKERSAKFTVRALIGGAAALFAKKHLKFIGAPVKNPFEDVDLEKRPSTRYHSTINLEELIQVARQELPVEQLKVFMLAGLAGLRRKEIDTLLWSAFQWHEDSIRIGPTRYHEVKSESSIGDVRVDPELMAWFSQRRLRGKDEEFVIKSDLAPRPRTTTYQHYRCKPVIDGLCSWLRSKGVNAVRPLHTLRKEFGSLVNKKHGIYTASRQLRHADIGITSQYYLDMKSRDATVGLGHLLKDAENVIPMPEKERQAG